MKARGNVYLKMNRNEEALVNLTKSMEIDPSDDDDEEFHKNGTLRKGSYGFRKGIRH